MFIEGEWVIDLMGEVGTVVEVKTLDRYAIVFPETKALRVRYQAELTHAPLETSYNDYNIHFLQTLAVNTGDKDWFLSLREKRGEFNA